MFIVKNTSELYEVAAYIIKTFPEKKIWSFDGDLGAGKTTLIQVICKYLGVEEAVTSPTFTIVNEYNSMTDTIYHFDFYRIKQPIEALQIGLYDYLNSGHYCFMEWAVLLEHYYPQEAQTIKITTQENLYRHIEII